MSSKALATSGGDEVVVKTRLQFDGDGTGDDRRLMLLLKNTIKFCADECSSAEDDARAHARLVAQVMQVEWTDAKSKLVQEMTAKEAKNYESLFETIRAKISSAETDIEEAKRELEAARKVRANRMEYDAMARQFQRYPSRHSTGKKIEEIGAELDRLKEEEEQLDEKLELRKKQFHVLVHSIHQLQRLLDQEEEGEDEDELPTANTNRTPEDSEETTNASNLSSSPEEAESNMDVS